MTWREWQEANNRFLVAGIEWVRLLIEVRIEARDTLAAAPPPPPPPPPPPKPVERASSRTTGAPTSWTQRIFGNSAGMPDSSTTPSGSMPLLTAGKTEAEQKLDRAVAAMAAAEAVDPPPVLVDLAHRVGLTRFERDVLLLGVASELSSAVGLACAELQRDPGRRYPTAALALTIFDDASWDLFSPERPLRRLRLVELAATAHESLVSSPIRVDDRVVSQLKGLSYLDERLAPFLEALPPVPEGLPLATSQAAALEEILGLLAAGPDGGPRAVQLVGVDEASKELIAQAVAMRSRLPLYRLQADLLPKQTTEAESFLRLWQREMVLTPAVLLVDAQDREARDKAGEPDAIDLGRFLKGMSGTILVATRDRSARLGQRAPAVDISTPTTDEQRQAWQSALGATEGVLPEQLASQFNLDLRAIHSLAATAAQQAAAGDAQALGRGLWRGCRKTLRARMEHLAQQVEPKATFAEIVLPPAELELLHQITSQVRNRSRVYEAGGFAARSSRGLGISALFHGESGTGKTMAAEVIANDLDLDLYRIDLSAVVSKYIGETEKNLRRLFDAAEYSGSILFFDEADALFGKRSEVKDSHDRYANIEVNYLLQRIESYRGLAILATNFKAAFDPAFFRRLRFMVAFPFPTVAQRREIWEKVFPSKTVVGPLDYAWLAKLNLTGGVINNVALGAAFLAAEAKTSVSMPLLVKAARTEMKKLDRPIDEAGLRWVGVDLERNEGGIR
jgi:AAA+ superfamily predicted ATPase